MEFLGGLIIIWLLYWTLGGGKQKHDKEEAEKAYKASLLELSKSPGKSDLKLATVMLGRKYSELSRGKDGKTTFSEKALMNEVNIASSQAAANSDPVASGAVEQSPSESQIHQRLRNLNELRQQDLISEDEYQSRRAEIIQLI